MFFSSPSRTFPFRPRGGVPSARDFSENRVPSCSSSPPGAARTPATSSVLRFVRCIGASSDRLVIYLLDTVSLNSSANLVLLALKFWENMTRLWNARTFDTMILFQVLLIELQSEQVFNGRSLTKIYQIEISSSRIIFFSIAF